ncbi:MAG: hypothetical protein INR71_10725 [Terriglobus roseus]|nr:hypothetical protein [Terriglobus roseus]
MRARLAVLSEVPDRWSSQLEQWSESNRDLRSGNYPDPNTEYFLYQSMLGAWPIDAERTKTYMQKAMREAKLETSWTGNNEAYEKAVASFIDGLFAKPEFLRSLEEFVGGIDRSGRVNSLTQTLLKYVSPGMPDLYQGGELWDHSLVDPDNRRPVDYDLRASLLKQLKAMSPQQFVETLESRFADGSPKLWLIHQALRLRNERPESFGADAAYTPINANGPAADHVAAFQRGKDVIAVGQRFAQTLGGDWGETTLDLPNGSWTDRLSGLQHAGGRIQLATLLQHFPVALLVRDAEKLERGSKSR